MNSRKAVKKLLSLLNSMAIEMESDQFDMAIGILATNLVPAANEVNRGKTNATH